jgi:citrate synthase
MWLDPSSGALTYRGVPIEELADRRDFEEVTHLLVTGRGPEEDSEGLAAFRRELRASRELPPEVLDLVAGLDPGTHPTRVLRAAISAVGCHELKERDDLAGTRQWRELRVVGQVTALAAAVACLRRGAAAVHPPAEASLATATLEAITGRAPSPAEVRALDLLWVLYAAHGLDPPTFAAMVAASCLADPYATVVASLSALRGPRFGGAAETVLDQLRTVSSPGDAEGWVRSTLARGNHVAGFGHHLYRMPDPRVVLLRKAAALHARRAGREELFEVARAVEDAATRALAAKGVFVNVNFWAAVLFHLLGADPPMVPCLLAVGRMAGLVALVREALETIRIFRPLTRAVGADERRLPERTAP